MFTKTLNQLFTTLVFVLLSFIAIAQNTNVFISGPEVMCAGDCATYTIETDQNVEVFSVVWISSDGAVFTDLNAFFCFNAPGVYTLTVEIAFTDGSVAVVSYAVFVEDFQYIDIYSNASEVCPANDSIPNPGNLQCEKVCSGSTVTYTANVPIFQFEGYWDIQGAESYEENGNQVTVTWGDPGFGNVNLVLFNSFCFSEGSICVEILDDPIADFTTIPDAINDTLTVCEGQSVLFENTSQHADTYLWNFGLNNTSAETNPSFTFINPGTYEVQLTAFNECFCSDTTSLIVVVTDAESPLVDCVGTICEGEIITYTAEASCGTYNWMVSGNGTITEGGSPSDNFITVDWATGPEGTIELQVGDCPGLTTCLEPAVIQVPILSDDALIEGPSKICRGAIVNYSIIPYEGTDFVWTISNFGSIIEGQGTNTITVEWYNSFIPTMPQWVAVSYENCYLECGGSDQLEVLMRPDFYATGPIEVCENSTTNYTSINVQNNLSFPSNWQIRALDGTLVWTSTAPADSPDIIWSFGTGRYTLEAIPANLDDFCTELYEIPIQVVPAPAPVDAILGSTQICPGLPYSYEVSTPTLNNSFEWTINNAGTVSTVYGNPINITWEPGGPYELSVLQISTDGLACASTPISIAPTAIPGFTINGTTDVCQDQTAIYSVTAYEQVEYIWTILPADAGTIISEVNSNTIEVLWHLSGPAAINLSACGEVDAIPVNILPRPEPVVLHPTDLCPNETATVQSTQMYSNYTWKDENGAVISNLADPMIGPGYYQLVVEDQNGCIGDTTFYINGWQPSDISISTPDDTGFCPGGPAATLYALDTDAGYTYQWYQDNVLIPGATGQTYTTAVFGGYHVEITDINNCSFRSNTIVLFEFCGFSGTCNGTTCTFVTDCDPGTNVSFEIEPTAECNVRNYINTSPDFVPGSLQWNFDDPDSGAENFSILENPTHTYTKAGFFTVILTGQSADHANPGSSELCWDAKVDTVLVAANFDVDNACPGEEVEFFDLSTFLPIASISGWEWNFGDPGSGAANTSTDPNPTHIFANQGSYIITLTVTGASGCTSSISKTLEIYPYPDVSFEEPLVNCQGTALNFIADVPNTVTYVEWDFGDPSSGEANISELFDSYHAYEAVGTYTVTLMAQSIYGCTNTFSRTVTIEPNTLNGPISLSTPSPICEGDNTILSAPPNGISWEWSTGDSTETLTVDTAGVYSLTITDSEGCEYSPDPVVIDVIPAPDAAVRAIEYNEFFQPILYYYENYEVCYGQDIYLEVVENTSYSYTWSNGDTGPETEYSEDRNNLLDPGSYDIILDVLDNTTGCMNEIGPFEITVHPLPADVQITASIGGVICQDTETIFSVVSPDPMLTYVWSNGSAGATLTTDQAGEYFVTAINAFGCETESNRLNILPGPDISKIPSGCHTRCRPDTICLPTIPGITSYQWYLDGVAIPAPDGTMAELIADQSGDYWLEMTDVSGCTLTSSTLTLDMYDGFGSIAGAVYFDVNENGIIDGPDTLVNGIDILLLDGSMTTLEETSSNNDGAYAFNNILSTAYTLELDTTSLPDTYAAYEIQRDTMLVGCDDEVTVNWLLFPACEPLESERNFSICPGETVMYNGLSLDSDTSFTALYQSLSGCDSMENVTVTLLETSTNSLQLEACENGTVTYDGQPLSPGTTQDFTFLNAEGCDSIVTVSVLQVAVLTNSLTLEACENGTVNYDGTDLNPGDIQDFTFIAASGCDSVVTVTVNQIPTPTSSLQLQACENGTVAYQGVDLSPGAVQDFTLVSSIGCDSIVTVSVSQIPTPTSSLQLQACENGTVAYQGVDLSPGAVQDFTLVSSIGCDSIVTVSVSQIPTPTSSLQLQACENGTVAYQGVDLSPGAVQDFTLVSSIGCDSIVTVSVSQIPTPTSSLQLQACENGTVAYQGVDLSSGAVQDFTLVSSIGCDSIVTVSVSQIPTPTSSLQLQACENGTVAYQGVDLSPGAVQDFTLVNSIGCDSIVTVSVSQIPTPTSSLQLQACENGTVAYQGVDLSPGAVQDFTLVSSIGCDSIVTVSVSQIPTPTSSLQLQACENGTVAYQGVDLSPGAVQDFTLVSSIGCDSIVTVSVSQIPTPTSSLQLQACENGTVAYQGVDLSPGAVQDFTLISSIGCDSIVTVSVNTIPIQYASLELQACENETIIYEGMELSVGEEMDIAFISTSNCDSIVTVNVVAYPEISFDVQIQESCPNTATGQLSVAVVTGGVPPYRYSLDGTNYVDQPDFMLDAGTYMVYVQDAAACVQELEAVVPALPSLQVATTDAILPCDDLETSIEVQLLSGLDVSYIWDDGSTAPSLQVFEPGIYQVEVANACETTTASISVNRGTPDLSDYFYIPNAFSPNSDGINDRFMAYAASEVQVESYTLDIFDRWGNQVYHSDDINEGWTGVYRSKMMSIGVYIWQVQATVNSCGEQVQIERGGDVALLK